MKRFFVNNITKPKMTLTGTEYKHLSEVLRAKTGDRVVFCPNDGRDYIYEITDVGKRDAVLQFVEDRANDAEAAVSLTVYFALLKGDKSELVVTKLTELGVRKIVPFVSEFTVKTGDKTERLKRAAIEACKQCGRARLPEICDIIDISEVAKQLRVYDAVIFAYEAAYGKGKSIKDVIGGNEHNIALIVGAEGGFSDSEVKLLIDNGAPIVTLGKRILRAETASIAASAVILNICGEWE